MAERTVQAGPFVGGVNNRLADNAMARSTPDGMIVDKLRSATNVILDDVGKLKRRKGYTLTHADVGAHSGFEYSLGVLYVVGGVLKLFDPDAGTTTTLISGLSNAAMAYVEVNGDVYYSNSVDTGKIVSGVRQTWGIAVPSGVPVLTAVTGALPAGRYQVWFTHETATGEESGASLGSAISVAGSQGVTISGIQTPPAGVSNVNIYCTHQNGDVAYKIASLPAGVSSLQFLTASYLGAQINTQFLVPPPPGNVLAYANGRIYTAYKKVLCFTEPLAYGLYRPSRNFIVFPGDITILAGVLDGVYVVSDKTYFLAGADPSNFVLNPVLPYGGAFGSSSKDISREDSWFWYGDRGLVQAGRGGQVKAVQETALSLDAASKGSTLFMEQNGTQQVISLSAPLGYNTSAAAQGFVDMEVRRKGI